MKNKNYRHYTFDEVEVSPVVKSYVDDLELFVGHTVTFALAFYLVFLALLFGVASIFYGQPFTNIDFFGMPLHEAWARTSPELTFGLILLSGVLAFAFAVMLSMRYIDRLKSIVLKDCDAYSYMTVVSYAMAKPVRRTTDLVYTMSYVEALCLHGKFEEALKFTEPFEHDKKKRVAWLYVRLNLAETKEEFEKLSSEYKRKSGLFTLRELQLNQNWQGIIDYVKEKFKPDMGYNWVYSNYYLAQAYYALGNKEAAFCSASIAFHGSQYLPFLHGRAFELYKKLSKEVVDTDILCTVDEYDERVMALGEPVQEPEEPVQSPDVTEEDPEEPVQPPEYLDIHEEVNELEVLTDKFAQLVTEAVEAEEETSSSEEETPSSEE